MRDGLRRVLTFTVSLSLIAGLGSISVAAQDEVTPAGDEITTAASLRSIRTTFIPNKRKNKLMAFNRKGYLPANIIKGTAVTRRQLRAPAGVVNQANNPVHWNQIKGVPEVVLKGDTTRSGVVYETPSIPPGAEEFLVVAYPVGLDVATTLVPTAASSFFHVANNFGGSGVFVGRSADSATIGELIVVQNVGTVASTVKLRLTVWNETYVSPAAAKRQVEVTSFKSLRNAKKNLRRR